MRTGLLFGFSLFVRLLPETRLFAMKRAIYRLCGMKIAPGVRICSSAVFLGPGRLTIGRNTWIGHQVMIVTGSSVTIGAEVDIAPRVFISTGTHEPGNREKAAGHGIHLPVKIEDGCWLGAGSLILPGTTLRRSTTVGAGAIVTRGTESPSTTIVGNPARAMPRPAGDGTAAPSQPRSNLLKQNNMAVSLPKRSNSDDST